MRLLSGVVGRDGAQAGRAGTGRWEGEAMDQQDHEDRDKDDDNDDDKENRAGGKAQSRASRGWPECV